MLKIDGLLHSKKQHWTTIIAQWFINMDFIYIPIGLKHYNHIILLRVNIINKTTVIHNDYTGWFFKHARPIYIYI